MTTAREGTLARGSTRASAMRVVRVIGFTFCVRADDVGSAATTGLAVAQAAGPAAGVGPEFYDVVVVPHSAVVVPLDEFDIPMPD
jgi:hypothetical protein